MVLEKEVDDKYYLSKWALKRIDKFGMRIDNNEAGAIKARTGGPQNDERYVNHDSTILISDSGLHQQPQLRKEAPPLRANTGAGHNNKLLGNSRIRRLTPKECERLQGFPDGWTEGVSDTQRYKMMGNAVSVPVIEAIGKKILKVIEEEDANL